MKTRIDPGRSRTEFAVTPDLGEAQATELDSLLRFIGFRLGAESVALVRGTPGTRGAQDDVVGSFGLDRAPLDSAQELLGEPAVIANVPSAGNGPVTLRAHFADAGTGMTQPARRRSLDSYAAVIALWLDDPQTIMGLLRSAYEDGLTGCLTYAALAQALADEVGRAERYGTPLSCCFIDLDGFKRVNDVAGHPVGNRVLAATAAAILGRVRRIDIVGRYGGDEFVVVLPGTDGVRAAFLASSLRDHIRIATGELLDDELGVSIGLAEWHEGLDAEGLLGRADIALREAKSKVKRGAAR